MGVCSGRYKLLWGKEEEEAWPEGGDPEQGFFVKAPDAEPYSALYVHLVVEIIYGWVHVNKILPSPQQLKTPAGAQEYCKKLLGLKYEGAYNRQQRMSVILSFNPDLWEDEAYHEAQRESNPHWRRKKEVYSAFKPGHVCFARIVPG